MKFQFRLVVVATEFVYDLVNSTKLMEDMIYPILETDGWTVYIRLSLLKAELQKFTSTVGDDDQENILVV